MTRRMTEPELLALQSMFAGMTGEPAERRCVVWWDGRKFGAHASKDVRDGASLIPRNVCARVFMSPFPATVCDTCAEMIQRIEDEDERALRQAAAERASAEAQRDFGKPKRRSW